MCTAAPNAAQEVGATNLQQDRLTLAAVLPVRTLSALIAQYVDDVEMATHTHAHTSLLLLLAKVQVSAAAGSAAKAGASETGEAVGVNQIKVKY